jgi:hypothetical protein
MLPYDELVPVAVTNEHDVNVHATLGIVKYYETNTAAYKFIFEVPVY